MQARRNLTVSQVAILAGLMSLSQPTTAFLEGDLLASLPRFFYALGPGSYYNSRTPAPDFPHSRTPAPDLPHSRTPAQEPPLSRLAVNFTPQRKLRSDYDQMLASMDPDQICSLLRGIYPAQQLRMAKRSMTKRSNNRMDELWKREVEDLERKMAFCNRRNNVSKFRLLK